MANASDEITSSRSEKWKIVKGWLFDLGLDRDFEEDDSSFTALWKLMEANNASNLAARQQISSYKDITKDYSEEEHKLRVLLHAGKLKLSTLRSSLRHPIQAAASTMCVAKPDDFSLESTSSALAEQKERVTELRVLMSRKEAELNELQEMMDKQEKSQAAATAAATRYQKAKAQQHRLTKESRFFQAKQQDYEHRRQKVPMRDVDPAYTHEEIVAYHQSLQDLQKDQKALQEQLAKYHGLQPDEEAVLRMLRQAMKELDTLEQDFQQRLSLSLDRK